NPRQQINEITAYLDGSVVYGSDQVRADWLRTMSGGRLKTSTGDLMPYNDGTIPNGGSPEEPNLSPDLFVGGDVRANEQVGLTSMHTVFVREHNRLAGLLQAQLPNATDEELYQMARRVVGAQIQKITYDEFLPALLGGNALPSYGGYDANVNASIVNEFSTAFYRFGHTMLLPEFSLVEPGGGSAGTLALRDAFFVPEFFDDPTNLDRVLGGLATRAQEIDAHLVDDVRNFLFGPPGAGGFDLASLNIQRGRDHGLETYNAHRSALGLLPKEKFLTDGVLADGVTPNGVTTDVDLANALAAVYDSVDDIDAWLGGLAEDPAPGTALSELVGAGLIEQFTRLRDGDRFYYENDPLLGTPEIQAVIDLDTINLQEIIELNTLARYNVSNIFVIPEPSGLSLLWLGMMAMAWRRRRWAR
ncbi:MAG: peroxidase family protein, partial [Planctomycetota bacterium]